MHWRGIEVKNGRPDTIDILDCSRAKGTKKCYNCPYVPACNKTEQGTTRVFNELLAPILLEECGINESEDNLN